VRRLAVLLATGFGIGYLPIAPATWASAAVTLVFFALLPRMDWIVTLSAIVAITPLAIWASGEAERDLGHDARPIVIDEVAGMLVAVCAVPMGAGGGARFAIMLALAFALFRVFDIWKPYPIRGSQSLPGGCGVVADDLLAGIYTNVSLQIVARAWPA
jgi:phosphatidylglycerophosphatase A